MSDIYFGRVDVTLTEDYQCCQGRGLNFLRCAGEFPLLWRADAALYSAALYQRLQTEPFSFLFRLPCSTRDEKLFKDYGAFL